LDVDVKAQMIVAGIFREGDRELDPELVRNAIAELRKHFVSPELARRGDNTPAEAVDQALVEFTPDGQTTVRLRDEADFIALAGTAGKVAVPSDVFVGQITELWPDGIDPNAGWTGYVTAQEGRVLVCDFRRNRESVRPLLDRSTEFLQAAELALSHGLIAPAVEHLNTAAELAVIVLMRLGAEKVGHDHAKRRQWLQRECELSDVPPAFAEAVSQLGTARNAARYAEGPVTLSASEARAIRHVVGGLVEYVAPRAS
jgi:HEPN domain-containing protein